MNSLAIVWSERALLLSGLTNTVVLTLISGVAALLLGALLCMATISARRAINLPARAFVDLMRCTPFLLLAYLVYYGLPEFDVRLSAWQAGLISLIVYHTAHIAEILRGAWSNLAREPIEAAHAFGFSGSNLYARIVLPPMLIDASPVLGNQTIQILKDTAFLTIITLPELTHAASSIQSRHYIPFASFMVAVALYWGICLSIEAVVTRVRRLAEARC